MNGHQPRDQRPANCRNRLFEEGKATPIWKCESCNSIRITDCPHERRAEPPTSGSGVMPPTTISNLTLACERLEAENGRLRAGLEIFADKTKGLEHIEGSICLSVPLKFCRAAAFLLETTSEAKPTKTPPSPPDRLGILGDPVPHGDARIMTTDGYRLTGRVRVKNNWLGLAVVECEEQFGTTSFGRKRWKRMRGYRIIAE